MFNILESEKRPLEKGRSRRMMLVRSSEFKRKVLVMTE